jgi:hypothetical protein
MGSYVAPWLYLKRKTDHRTPLRAGGLLEESLEIRLRKLNLTDRSDAVCEILARGSSGPA